QESAPLFAALRSAPDRSGAVGDQPRQLLRSRRGARRLPALRDDQRRAGQVSASAGQARSAWRQVYRMRGARQQGRGPLLTSSGAGLPFIVISITAPAGGRRYEGCMRRSSFRTFVADWRRWSPIERVAAVLLLAGIILMQVPLPL